MPGGNGDERDQRTLERVEARLDAIGEELHGIRRLLQALTDRVLLQAHEIDALRSGQAQLRGDLDALRGELRGGLASLREELDLRFQRLRVDLGTSRLDAMESSIAALTRRVEALGSR